MLTRRNFSLALVTALLTCSGCGNPLQGVIQQFDKVIDEFKKALRHIQQESQSWQIHTQALVNQTEGKVRTIIEDGTLGHLLTLPVHAAGDELKTLVVMIERRLLGYLRGVINALEAKRAAVVESGGIAIDTVESVLAEVIASVDDVSPFVGAVTELTLACRRSGNSQSPITDRPILFRGFNFRTEHQYRLVGFNALGQRVWTAPQNALERNTEFVISFAPTKAAPFPATVDKLTLEWTSGGGAELASILLTPAPAAPPQPKLTGITIGFRGLDVKYPTVAFIVEFTLLNEAKQTLATIPDCGRGDIWEKQQYAHYSVSLDLEAVLAGSSTLIVDLTMLSVLGGPVQHTYQSTGGLGQQTFYSKTHQPRTATTDQLLRMGFRPRGLNPSHTKWDLRDPLRLVATDWKGFVRLSVDYGGRLIEFDESEQIAFRNGRPKDGKQALRLQWKGTGISMA
ncbi:MAG: hypothetical protein ACKV0T_00210 [Planctomycetales bacterium]